jgi:formylglycine-generating enzyme required for sulfatase activity
MSQSEVWPFVLTLDSQWWYCAKKRIFPSAAGNFMMGCSAGDDECHADEKPAHRGSITRPFEMGKYQVTQARYEAVTSANPSYSQGPNLQVEGLSWDDARKFCEAVNRKGGWPPYLPTLGNVWEWAQDWYSITYYSHSPESDPKGPVTGENFGPNGTPRKPPATGMPFLNCLARVKICAASPGS